MAIALQVNGLSKRFRAGSGRCIAGAAVLRSIDLSVRTGEIVAIVGDPGSGKSTLLLCLAGLIAPDAGAIRWFSDESRITASRRAVYHVAPADLMRGGRIEEPNLHLVDVARHVDADDLARWAAARRACGDAVIVAARRDDHLRSMRPRVYRMRSGELHEQRDRSPWIRVAEPAHH